MRIFAGRWHWLPQRPAVARLSRLACLLAVVVAAPALAEKRVALVIGNGAYKYAPALPNPKNDAVGLAAALKRLKFDVIEGHDLDEIATRRLLRELSDKLDGFGKEDVALFFYAGHGLQVNGRNYIVPVDAKLERERDLDFQAVAFDFVQQLMEKTPQTNIVMLDSCRDNPLARTLARGMGARSGGIGRGLAEMRGINDTLIVYATNPGNVALDGKEKNSPFTAALLKHIEQPGLEVRHMISQVRAAVIASTNGQQVPWESASLTRQVYFAPGATPAAPGATPAQPPSPGATPPGADQETVFWQTIKESKNAADYKAYLAKYPQGTFAELAKIRLAELERASADADRKKDADVKADAERKTREEAERKRIQAEALARLGGQRLDQARAALKKSDFGEARRLALETQALLKEAGEIFATSPVVAAAARNLDAFKRDLDRASAARAAVLVKEARELLRAGKIDEADKRLTEAATLEPASAEIAAARREYEAARKKAEGARVRAEEERKKKEEAAKKGPQTESDDDRRAKTRDVVRDSSYDDRRSRGVAFFAFGNADLTTAAADALGRGADAAKAQERVLIALCGYDQLEAANAAAGQRLAQERCRNAARVATQRGLAAVRIRTGIAAPGKGPDFRRVAFALQEDKQPGVTGPDASSRPGALQLAGRAGTISRLSPERKIVMRIHMQFGSGGVMGVSCVGELAVGGQGGCYGQPNGTGTWSLNGSTLCLSSAVINLAERTCFQVSGSGSQLVLSGPGLLAGVMFVR